MLTKQAKQEFLRSRVRLKPKMMKGYDIHLTKFEGHSPKLPEVPQPIRDFLNNLPVGDETAHAHWRTLRALYREITAQHPKIKNPMPLVKAPPRKRRVMRTFSPEQLSHLFAQSLSLRDRVLINLLLDSGVRAGEAASLLWEDVFPSFVVISGKTGERVVPISPDTYQAIMALKRKNGANGHVFMGKRGPLSYEGVYKAVRRACQRADITGKRASPHTFRHTFGTLMIAAGCDLNTVRITLGHSDIKVTEKYVHQNIAPIIEKHRMFSPLKLVRAASQRALFEDEALKEAEVLAERAWQGETKEG